MIMGGIGGLAYHNTMYLDIQAKLEAKSNELDGQKQDTKEWEIAYSKLFSLIQQSKLKEIDYMATEKLDSSYGISNTTTYMYSTPTTTHVVGVPK